MKQELTTTNNQAVQEAELIQHLNNLGLTSKLTDGEKNTFVKIAQAFNLNPFKREVHVSKYGDQMAIITGYEVYIKRAERSGLLDGWRVETTGSIATNDLTAILTINRKDQSLPFKWEVYYDECVQRTKEGNPTKFWQKARFMLKKVAMSQGFRLCFSDELGGMPYTADEMPDQQTEDVTHVIVEQPKKLEAKPILKAGTKSWTNAIKALRDGKTIESLREVADISAELEIELLNAVEEAA